MSRAVTFDDNHRGTVRRAIDYWTVASNAAVMTRPSRFI